jgi:hypothetical protein
MNHQEPLLTTSQQIVSAVFLLAIGIVSLDVSWHGYLHIPRAAHYTGSAVLGAIAAPFWVRGRYLVIGLIAGAVAGFSGAWFTTFCLDHSDSAYKIVVVFAVALGALPGLGVLFGLKWLQDRIWPPRRRAPEVE